MCGSVPYYIKIRLRTNKYIYACPVELLSQLEGGAR